MDFEKLYFNELNNFHSLKNIGESIGEMQECLKCSWEYIRELEQHVKELELRCRTDSMTGMWNHAAYDEFLDEMEDSQENAAIGVIFADINGLKAINDNKGHAYGDDYIVKFSEILLQHFEAEECFHISGDEFVVILKGISQYELTKRVGKLSNQLKMKHIPVASLGCAWSLDQKEIRETISDAEKMMYMDKSRWRKKHYRFGQNVG